MNPRIIALNLPAKATSEVAGNPSVSRLESAIANCFPGLEIDHRNLDRRFFPGLIFNFIANSDSASLGARLIAVDLNDPKLPGEKQFSVGLLQFQAALQQGKKIFLHALRQKTQEIINLWNEESRSPLDGLIVWRLIRSLTEHDVTITLAERDESGIVQVYPEITAHRRQYQQEDGTLSTAYSPGELSQSLCSPWQHDFRDCSCNYWASNHPDIVLEARFDTELESTEQPQNVQNDERPLMWLRWNQSKGVPPYRTRVECRPFEMDYYEINERWQDLPIVLQGHEQRTPYSPGPVVSAAPFENTDQLVQKLEELAGIEHALALEYLYARYTVRFDDSRVPSEARDAAEYIAHELLMIATSEMMHLRWVNQLLWELLHAGYIKDFTPKLQVATHVPDDKASMRPVAMMPLDQAITNFIDAEVASGTVEGAYAKVYATLRHGYPPSLAELSSRIIADGVSHFTRFREILAILRYHADPQDVATAWKGAGFLVPDLVHNISVSVPTRPQFNKVKSLYVEMIDHLQKAYRFGNADDRVEIAAARKAMMDLDTESRRLAGTHPPLGIPFSEIGYEIAGKIDNGPKR
jgi:hypothetical protein